MKHGPLLTIILSALVAILSPALNAAEESPSWPLGPIGGSMKFWTGKNFVRVSEITPGGPGELAGLQVDDFIYGAFDRDFDPIGSDFQGVVRQLGNAIEHAESTDGQLPLRVLRSGSGETVVTVTLPILGPLGPAYPVTSAKYADTYEFACAELHARVQSDSDGNLGYPTGFIGLALLGHPNWNDTTGEKPYRLSIDKIRDYFISRVHGAVYTPVEDLLLDDPISPSDNPNYVDNPIGLESWTLGQAVMFLAEYRSKTGDSGVDADLQLGAELMANRIQYWKQPARHENGYSPEYERVRGMTSHGGVTGDYIHLGWGGGINMTGVHLFGGLALAKRAGVDMDVRPRDGHLFGFDLNPGDPIPDSISSALPGEIVLPRGSEDTRSLAIIDNSTNAPFTTITDPWYYDLSLDQKFWMKWDFLYRSSGNDGHVNYAVGAGGTYDAGGRTPGALFGLLAYLGDSPLDPIDVEKTEAMKNYITTQHDRHLHAHAYNMGGGLFTALILPWLDDRQQLFFLENWKFYVNFMRQPDGSLSYF